MVPLHRTQTILAFFTLLFYIQNVSTDCSTVTFHRLKGNYIIQPLTMPSAFQSIETSHRNMCGRLCSSKRFCKVWTFTPGKCHLYHSMKDSIEVIKAKNLDTEIYYEINEGKYWTKIFFVEAGSGINVSNSFLGNDTYINKTVSITQNYFRSFWIDVWDSLKIKKVRLSLLKNGVEVRHIIFTGNRSNKENWFSMKNVLSSNWVDVQPNLPHGIFNITFSDTLDFVAELKQGNCSESRGWMAVVTEKTGCGYDNGRAYPYIRYSAEKHAVKWNDGYAVADALALYIKIQ